MGVLTLRHRANKKTLLVARGGKQERSDALDAAVAYAADGDKVIVVDATDAPRPEQRESRSGKSFTTGGWKGHPIWPQLRDEKRNGKPIPVGPLKSKKLS